MDEKENKTFCIFVMFPANRIISAPDVKAFMIFPLILKRGLSDLICNTLTLFSITTYWWTEWNNFIKTKAIKTTKYYCCW